MLALWDLLYIPQSLLPSSRSHKIPLNNQRVNYSRPCWPPKSPSTSLTLSLVLRPIKLTSLSSWELKRFRPQTRKSTLLSRLKAFSDYHKTLLKNQREIYSRPCWPPKHLSASPTSSLVLRPIKLTSLSSWELKRFRPQTRKFTMLLRLKTSSNPLERAFTYKGTHANIDPGAIPEYFRSVAPSSQIRGPSQDTFARGPLVEHLFLIISGVRLDSHLYISRATHRNELVSRSWTRREAGKFRPMP